MKAYLLVGMPEEKVLNDAKQYIELKEVMIDQNNIMFIDQFKESEKAIVFFVSYQKKNKSHKEIAEKNFKSGGKNISISGDNDEYILECFDQPDYYRMNTIIKENVNGKVYLDENNDKDFFSYGKKEGSLITINSPKGGVGKSFLTFNIAYLLSKIKKPDAKVLVVDYNLSEGSLTRYFNESEEHITRLDNIVEQYMKRGTISRAFIEDTIVSEATISVQKQKIEGIDFLFAPDNFTSIPRKINANPDFNIELFKKLRSMYDVIITDTCNEKNITANDFLLKNSDKILFVVTTNPNSIIQLRDYISALGIQPEKYDLIYNDYNKITSTYPLETVVSGIFKVQNGSNELKQILNNKVYVVETNIGIKKADHNWDTIFNKSKKYLTTSERSKYLNTFYKILKNNIPEGILDIKDYLKNQNKFFKSMFIK